MNPNKLNRFLFELTKDARITTKELASALSMSQQTASYTTQKLLKEKTVQDYQTIIDPAKLGLMNIIVLYHYLNFDPNKKSSTRKALRDHPDVTRVEEVSQGADLLVEYSVPNLSYFNKQHTSLIFSLKETLSPKETYVVIVKHLYTRNYLHKRHPKVKEAIICGDRDVTDMDKQERATLDALSKDPKTGLATIARKLKKDPKTITKTKKWLEKRKVIRGYGAVIDHRQLGISREHILLSLQLDEEADDARLREHCKQDKNIISLTKTVGPYDLAITTERLDKDPHPIDQLRREFHVKDYRILHSDRVDKHTYLPDNDGKENT
ncbi:Lrp/AsnC family transcriptional regulator [Candidatus Woesearchaeota archaeon]|nr:Lrp/AsnC family transcriptional regulator [Candidatus Woesearchaeota archaeon]